jgi:hypothetical protein
LVLACVLGCQQTGGDDQAPPVLVPVKGKVTLDGKPLPGASIGFLPRSGPAGAAEVKEDGSYEIQYMGGAKGLPVGDYVVQVSYVMGRFGKPLSIAEQFSLVPSEARLGAKELLPKKYSDFGASELRAKVPPDGGTFNFDLNGPLAEPPPLVKESPEGVEKEADKPKDGGAAKDGEEAKPKDRPATEGAAEPAKVKAPAAQSRAEPKAKGEPKS